MGGYRRHNSDSSDFGIIKLTMRVRFRTYDFEEIVEEAVNCNGFSAILSVVLEREILQNYPGGWQSLYLAT